ncbi:SLC15A1 [Acanthosepion pharaonis]|uniref:SLC15A1 n=1 Tax=Acanthosepion pharaonis TaxID=158019 RepID=A0A812DIP3_ACAPH|nr:SLC15A1 [Sepia pharaonis]
MLLSLTIFLAGRKQYKKNPPTGNLFAKVCGCIFYSLKQCWVQRHNKMHSHWLNLALDKYDPVFVEEVKSLLRVLVMFLPLPLFWALFDQQGSRWTLQAQLMDGSLGSLGILKPDQMQALNPILIIMMIPLFESVIYPIMDKCRIPNRPLQRMVTGMIFATSAFLMADQWITMINVATCEISVESVYYTGNLKYLQSSNFTRNMAGNLTIKYSKSCVTNDMVESDIYLENGQASRLFFYEKYAKIHIQTANDLTDKPPKGMAAISLFSMLPKENLEVIKLKAISTYTVINFTESTASPFFYVDPAMYEVYGLNKDDEWFDTNHTLEINSGASYTVVAIPHGQKKKFDMKIYQGLTSNSVSMLLQIPKYILITTGEVIFPLLDYHLPILRLHHQ